MTALVWTCRKRAIDCRGMQNYPPGAKSVSALNGSGDA